MYLKYLLASVFVLAAAVATAQSVKSAPSFQLTGVTDTVALSAYKGRVVYVDFWASWCSPCKDSFPWMNKMQAKYADQGFVVIAINVDRKQDDAYEFLSKEDVNFPVAFDHKGDTPKQYEVMGMPSAYVIGKDGNILHAHIGFNTDDTAEYEKHIQQALSLKGSVQ